MSEPLVAIHTMGKVGSSSVVRAVRAAGVEALHTHYLNLAVLQAAANRHDQSPHIAGSRALVSGILEGRHLRIVSLVREPTSRNIASYLSALRNRMVADPIFAETDPATLAEQFADYNQNQFPVTWWGQHLCEPLQIDIFGQRFDPEVGHTVIRKGIIELLIMRSDLDDAVKADCLGSFLGADVPAPGRINSSTVGRYVEVLDEIRSRVVPDPTTVERLRSSPEVTHWLGNPN